MLNKASPSVIRDSRYGPPVGKRAADLPGMVGLGVAAIFPDIPKALYVEGGDVSIIRKATERALENVKIDMIRPQHTVNILTSQYGFMIMGGYAYAEMVKTIKEVIERKTGCSNIRLRVATGFRIREPEEIIRHYKLDEFFKGKASPALFLEKGVPIALRATQNPPPVATSKSPTKRA